MALADTARLIASLELQDKFSRNAALFDRTVGGLERRASTLGRVGSEVGRGLGAAAGNLKLIGVAAAGIIGVNVAAGIATLQRLETVTAQTNAVLKSTQGVAGQTGESIRLLAEKYESLNATIDDKVIQSGENLLLTFTSISKKAFEPALVAALNLNTALGGGEEGLQGTIIQVGKALQDPVRGLTNLRRVGVNFSEQQKTQIKDLIAQNKLYDAQQVILAELTKEFGGSFAAAGDTAAGKFAKLRDAVEDSQSALATALLPVLGKVADKLQTVLADPKTVAALEGFGAGLADGFDKAVALAGQLPWDSIGSAFKLLGTGAKFALDAFAGAPPWLQTAVLTGWGLNKLTSGALGNIVGALGSGLIKGVLGMNAGVVNINAAVVNGGLPSVGPKGGLPPLLPFVGRFAAPAVVAAAGTVFSQGSNANTGTQAQMISFAAHKLGATIEDVMATGATLGAFSEFAKNPELRVGVNPALLTAIDKLAGQLPGTKQTDVLVSQFTKSRATSEQLRSLMASESSRTAARQERIQALLAPLPFGIGALVAKDFSPKLNVTLSTVVNVGATQMTQSIRRLLTANATRLTDAGVGL